MKDIKAVELPARQEYEPIRMEVIDVAPQGVLCGSGRSGSGIRRMFLGAEASGSFN